MTGCVGNFQVEPPTAASNCWRTPSCADIDFVVCFREYGDQDGEVGELEGRNNASGLLSHSSVGPGQLESPLPPQSKLDLDKRGNRLSAAKNLPDRIKSWNPEPAETLLSI